MALSRQFCRVKFQFAWLGRYIQFAHEYFLRKPYGVLHSPMKNLAKLSASLFALSIVSVMTASALAGDVKVPSHPPLRAGTFSALGNSALPSSKMVPQTTIVTSANATATHVSGVVKSVRLTDYKSYRLASRSNAKDYTVALDRQVYVVDISLPNGIESRGGKFGPNSEMLYAVDAETGKFISSSIRGPQVGPGLHSR